MSKEFKSFLKLPGGSEITNCFYPFKLDTYGCGCSNDCSYCYAKSVLSFRGLWNPDNSSVADIEKIEKVFRSEFENGKKGKYSHLFEARVPIRLGGMTDAFSKNEETYQVTFKLLEILKRYNYPALILTKNTLVASDKYLKVLDPELDYIQFSITTPFDDVSKVYESGANTTSERFDAIRKLTGQGYYTAVRINPLFPIYPDGYYSTDMAYWKKDIKPFRYFDWSLLDMVADAGSKTVIAGFLRLSSWNIKWCKEVAGVDLTYLFNPKTKQSNSSLHFSTEEKRFYYEKMKKLCNDRGIDFSVCYDGDEAYKEFQYLWANPMDCCNGLGKIRGFSNNYKQFFPDEK